MSNFPIALSSELDSIKGKELEVKLDSLRRLMEQNKIHSCLFPQRNGRVLWEITAHCNAACLHCCTRISHTDDEMSLGRSKEVLLELRQSAIKEVYFTGGEPLLREDLLTILKLARQYFEVVTLSSNGLRIDKHISSELAKIKPNQVRISIDHHDPDFHDGFRGVKGLFDAAHRAVTLLIESTLKVGISTAITKDNYMTLEQMVLLAIDWGASAILFNWILPVGKAALELGGHPPEEAAPFISGELHRLKQRYETEKRMIRVQFRRNDLHGAFPLEPCPGGTSFFFINPQGRVGPCPWISKIDQRFLTNSLQEETFAALLKTDQMRDYRHLVLKRGKVGKCKNCEILNCGFGCPALARINTGTFDGFDPLCPKQDIKANFLGAH